MTKVACLQMWLDEGQSKEDRIIHAEKMIDGNHTFRSSGGKNEDA